jgi:hypothetical protein
MVGLFCICNFEAPKILFESSCRKGDVTDLLFLINSGQHRAVKKCSTASHEQQKNIRHLLIVRPRQERLSIEIRIPPLRSESADNIGDLARE